MDSSRQRRGRSAHHHPVAAPFACLTAQLTCPRPPPSLQLRGVAIRGRERDESDPLLLGAQSAPGHYVPHIGYDKVSTADTHSTTPTQPQRLDQRLALSSHSVSLSLSLLQLDFSLLAQLFGGRPAYVFVHVVMMLYSLCALWAYAAVFASSVDSIFFRYALDEECNIYLSPSFECSVGYTVFVLLFAVIVTYLSLQDVGDQAFVQKMLTAYRFSAFFLMIVTCAIAFFYPNSFDADASPTPPTFAHLPSVQWSGFGLIFCTTAVALDVHWNIADVLLPLREKQNALRIALPALLCAAAFYTVIALVCALEFGHTTFPLATLNWNSYTGLAGGWGAGPMTKWSLVVKLFIICFPVTNQMSVYPRQHRSPLHFTATHHRPRPASLTLSSPDPLLCPVVVLTLGDNYFSLAPSSYHASMSPVALKRLCRLAACLPPILLALLLGKLDVIFSIVGLFAFALEFIVPCLLQLQSMRVVREKYGAGSEWTRYSSFISHTPVVWVVLVLGCLALVVSVTSTLMGAGEV